MEKGGLQASWSWTKIYMYLQFEYVWVCVYIYIELYLSEDILTHLPWKNGF